MNVSHNNQESLETSPILKCLFLVSMSAWILNTAPLEKIFDRL